MSALHTISELLERASVDETIYASKDCVKPIARHGMTGWRKISNTERERMIFLTSETAPNGLWIPYAIHLQNMKNRKESNRRYYAAHPELLREKLRSKYPGRFVRAPIGRRFLP